MQIISPINIPFYLFTASEELKKVVFNHVDSLEFQNEAKPEYGWISPNYFHPQLFDFFDECVKEVQSIYYKDHLSFPIVDCWVNKYTTSNRLVKHNHPNSIICGLYYVTTHEGYGSTIFEASNPWNFMSPSNNMMLTINKETNNIISGKIEPRAGNLVLFPPSLVHYMDTIQATSTTRYTIAFNTFVSGIVDNVQTKKISIQSVSLRSKFKPKPVAE